MSSENKLTDKEAAKIYADKLDSEMNPTERGFWHRQAHDIKESVLETFSTYSPEKEKIEAEAIKDAAYIKAQKS